VVGKLADTGIQRRAEIGEKLKTGAHRGNAEVYIVKWTPNLAFFDVALCSIRTQVKQGSNSRISARLAGPKFSGMIRKHN
jgi:hypothetical protein